MKAFEGPKPNLFIAGAMKAGTTGLFQLLKGHRDVYMSPVKEPHFFADDIDSTRFAPAYKPRPLDFAHYCRLSSPPEIHSAYFTRESDYLCLFKNANGKKIIGEASTSYLYSRNAASNIRRALPDARIIIVLRNPVERAYSHFQMDVAIGRVKGTFRRALEDDLKVAQKGWGISRLYIELGMYFEQVNRFLNHFPRHQVLVLLFDEFRRLDEGLLDKIADFLDVDRKAFVVTDKRHNQRIAPRFSALNYILHHSNLTSMIREAFPNRVIQLGKKLYYGTGRKKGIDEEDIRFLMPFFESDLEALSLLIERDLSHWLTIA